MQGTLFVLCGDLNGKEIKKKRGDLCKHIVDSLCYTAETNIATISSVQSLSRVRLFTTPWTAACQTSLSLSQSFVFQPSIQDWSPLGWTGWISLQSKGLSSLLQHHSSKALILWHSAFFSHPYMTTGKTIALTRLAFVGNYTPIKKLIKIVAWI